MIKIYKFKANEDINEHRLRVSQTYKFTPKKEYVGRCKDFNTMLIYDDLGNGIEFDIPKRGNLKLYDSYAGVFNVIDSFEVKNKKELNNEILKTK